MAESLPFTCTHCQFPLNAKEDAETASTNDGVCKMCFDRWFRHGRKPDRQELEEYLATKKLKWLNFPAVVVN